MYTDAVAVPTGYFRGVAAKRDTIRSQSTATKLGAFPRQRSRGMTFGRQPRCLPLSAIFAVAHTFRPSGHILDAHSAESWTRTKTAHPPGQRPTRPPEEHNSAVSDRYWGPCHRSDL